MFIILDILIIFHTEFLGMIMICLLAKFHMSSLSDSLVTAMEPRTKYRSHAATMSFSILQKELPQQKLHICLVEDILPCIIS